MSVLLVANVDQDLFYLRDSKFFRQSRDSLDIVLFVLSLKTIET